MPREDAHTKCCRAHVRVAPHGTFGLSPDGRVGDWKGREGETFQVEGAAFVGTGRVSKVPLLRWVAWLLGQAGMGRDLGCRHEPGHVGFVG